MDYKRTVWFRHTKHRLRHELLFELSECSFTLFAPDPGGAFLKEAGEGAGNVSIPEYKFAVVPSQTEKTPKLSSGLRWQKALHGSHLLRVWFHDPRFQQIPQERHFL